MHLESVSDLGTEDFLCVLNRFFNRRSRSMVIYSDNATHFVDANRQLKELNNLLQSEERRKSTDEML